MTMHDKPQKIKKYAPVFENIYAPLADWCDAPYRCVRINEDWVKLIVGVMEILRWPDLYDDTTGRAEHVARSVQGLMDSMMDDDCSDLDLCGVIADCITGSTIVQVALVDAAATNGTNYAGGGYPVAPVSPAVTQENLLSDVFVCDNDHAFATARAIAEGIHQSTLEVFQAIEVVTNPIEIAAEVADNIPILGAIVATAFDVVAWIQDTIWEVYWAAWSDTVRDDIACDLYCIIISDPECSISFDQVFAVYQDAIGLPGPADDADVKEWLEWMMSVPLTVSRAIVSAGSMLGLISLKFGAKYADWNLGIRSLKLIIALAADETSNDWELLCAPCLSKWTATCDLTGLTLPPSIEVIWGDFVAESGVWAVCDGDDPENKVAVVGVNPPAAFDMTKTSYEYRDRQLGGHATASSVAAWIAGVEDGLPGVAWRTWSFGQVFPGDHWLPFTSSKHVTGWLRYMNRSDRFGCDGQVRITTIVIKGTEFNPFDGLEGWEIT